MNKSDALTYFRSAIRMNDDPANEHPSALPAEIRSYLDTLVTAYQSIASIWLIGSRAKPDSDWDFFAFATPAVLTALRSNDSFRRPLIDLIIVTDNDHWECPWPRCDTGNLKKGRLREHIDEIGLPTNGWQLNEVSPTAATYLGESIDYEPPAIQRAFRIYPNEPRRLTMALQRTAPGGSGLSQPLLLRPARQPIRGGFPALHRWAQAAPARSRPPRSLSFCRSAKPTVTRNEPIRCECQSRGGWYSTLLAPGSRRVWRCFRSRGLDGVG